MIDARPAGGRPRTGLVAAVALALAAFATARAATAPATASEPAPASLIAPAPAGVLRVLRVDAAGNAGALRSLQGVNGAPAPGAHKPPDFSFGGWNMPPGVDVTRGYREARIDLVRTHDAYGPTDIDARFHWSAPGSGFVVGSERSALDIFPDLNADPENPASYHFAASDRVIASIEGIGAQVIYRLGRSETSDVTPPPDFRRYAAVAEHIVRHYNGGWDHGFRYGIRYWEVWNEPDLGRLFWGGTPEQFYRLYAEISRAVKRADPQALVGGPTLAKPNDDSPYQDGFLRYVRMYDLPLDFYSWHWYATDSEDPLDFVRIARAVRARLDRSGFPRTLSILDEWNYGLDPHLPPDITRASFVASALIYMQDAPIDRAALYRADNLFGADGATANKTGAALIALGRMKDTPLRLPVQGADLQGFAVLAGRSADGSLLQVLVSNYEIPPKDRGPRQGRDVISVPNAFEVRLLPRRSSQYAANAGYALTIENLPPGARYSLERWRIDAAHTLVREAMARACSGRVRVAAQLPAPGIELVVLRRAAAPMSSGARAAPQCGRATADGS